MPLFNLEEHLGDKFTPKNPPTGDDVNQLVEKIRSEYPKDVVPDDAHLYIIVKSCLIDADSPDSCPSFPEVHTPESIIRYIEERLQKAVVVIPKKDFSKFGSIPSGKNEWAIIERAGSGFQYQALAFYPRSPENSHPRPLGK